MHTRNALSMQIGRTAELARTFGIDFFSVLTRGSQYRVESLMLRLSHACNYLAVSASREQPFQMRLSHTCNYLAVSASQEQ
eukprot:scaffold58178_cov19-Tisochrysis_lutea.AAC.1